MEEWTVICMLGTALIAFLVSALLGKWLIPELHKLKFGQTIRDVGPAWHKNKQGTPTMGGLLFIIGMAASLLIAIPVCEWLLPELGVSGTRVLTDNRTITRLLGGFLMMLGCGAIGFVDDYIKVVKKRNLGLTEKQKLFAQLLIALLYALSLYLAGDHVQQIPFVGRVDLGWWFVPLCMFIVVAATNAVNLTDGIDGLCGTVSFMAALPFLVLAGVWSYMGQGLTSAALAGSLLGFLMWNLHPAKVFMGDTGSLFIGGALCAVAFGVGRPLLLVPVGIVYVLETLSVILQVTYFKLTHGKRLFKMSPIHHHFEMCGWKENTIVTVFSAVTLAGCVAAMLLEWYA